jgi:hypothetical protein
MPSSGIMITRRLILVLLFLATAVWAEVAVCAIIVSVLAFLKPDWSPLTASEAARQEMALATEGERRK